ncbi:helix-hairpin-helix domain-containing protein [Croceitalea sp. P059]|uniref:ComEA family DNA-binding protein n=1 Tax=Croceitalea sp. P059 TaxID=3075601 RepID=UPI002885A23F|nr:helix-hairpin-helix domain-containing protein [Croceitalea sp. P059]MDT0541054.1 helix-hairpin-helix domain-containing protein [Croceitalea sp. P059]
MKNFKSHFKFNKQERSGIFFLILLIIVLQGIYFYIKTNPLNDSIVHLNQIEQKKIDSLKKVASQKKVLRIFPFNPNFISDYKGYTLGMSPKEIDRLHLFRETNKFINSKEEFQQVTLVSDSLLGVISPFFKFPNWVSNEKVGFQERGQFISRKEKTIIQNLNTASASQLKSIRGIGDKLSTRIIKFRDRLGGFLINEQLYDVYGLEPNVVESTLEKFQVLNPPTVNKININTATILEISSLVYIPYQVAIEIVEYRELQGRIKSFEQLTLIEGFPAEKLERIVLYLSL